MVGRPATESSRLGESREGCIASIQGSPHELRETARDALDDNFSIKPHRPCLAHTAPALFVGRKFATGSGSL